MKNYACMIVNLKNQPLMVEEWDESLWALMIEKAVVSKEGSIKFVFNNGTEITAGVLYI